MSTWRLRTKRSIFLFLFRRRINIFSLASGHLYERFLKIMMLSVSRSASQKVHFWLIENFLSPQFKVLSSPLFTVGFRS